MRILYLCTFYHRAMLFRNSMDVLEKRGHDVIAFNATVMGTKIDDKYKSIMDDKVIHEECFKRHDRFIFPVKQRKIESRLLDRIDVRTFDIIHSHTFFNGGWAARNISKKTGVPFVVSVRNTDMNAFLRIPVFLPVARKIAKDAAGIVFLSESYKKKFLDRCFGNSSEEKRRIEKKCTVIANGLESFWLENKGEAKKLNDDKLKLICVGKIDRNKNVTMVLKTVEELKRRGIDTSLTVIGQVLDSEVLRELDDSSDVERVDFLPKEKLIGYYRANDIFVMPSLTESFGRVYAEAMTQGLPVIYTRGQGFDGRFPEGRVGYSVNPKDSDEIADAVIRIMDNYHTVSSNCINESDVFDWDMIAAQIERFYKECLI